MHKKQWTMRTKVEPVEFENRGWFLQFSSKLKKNVPTVVTSAGQNGQIPLLVKINVLPLFEKYLAIYYIFET